MELKYCEDTRPMGQLEHAHSQHTELIARLKAEGCCAAVHLHVIFIGVAGTIYIPHTLEPLKRLGLDHQHVTQLACKLNAHSCAYARKLAGTRYALAAATDQQRRRPHGVQLDRPWGSSWRPPEVQLVQPGGSSWRPPGVQLVQPGGTSTLVARGRLLGQVCSNAGDPRQPPLP